MSPSEPIATRMLVVDTMTPGTEISIINAKGDLVGQAIRKLEAELPIALYKVRCRIGDRVADTLIELAPGQNPFYVPGPQLPIFSSAPPTSIEGRPSDYATEFAQSLIAGPPVVRGSGASLFVFVSADQHFGAAPPMNPAASLSLWSFSGQLIADLTSAPTGPGCAGCNFELDPGRYLLRSELDGGRPIEQTIVVARDWQTRIYIRLIESGTLPTETSLPRTDIPTPGWRLDLPQMGIIMVRDNPASGPPSPDDVRWTAAARQALAARRSEAAPNREMMQALLQGKFENPMWGIYAGHLLAMQPNPDRALLREVYTNLSNLVGEHPDVEALLIALRDPKAYSLTYWDPPMLVASWSLVLRASTTQRDLRPERSYSARIAASLWGSGAWLSWRMPPPDTTAVQPSPGLLLGLIDEASAGRLDARLNDLEKRNETLSPIERLLVSHLMAMNKRLQLANECTADEDSSSFFGGTRFILPVYRHFVDSDLQEQTKEKIAGELNAKKLSDSSGIPYSAVLEAASTLGQKLGLPSSSFGSHFFKTEERIMADGPGNVETPLQKLSQAARHLDIQAANDSARAATQAAILINGGAAIAILAFLSTYLSKGPSPPTRILDAASWSLMGYALGVCFGAVSIWCSSQASAQFGLRWEAFLDVDKQAEAKFLERADKQLQWHRSSFALSILLFFISSLAMAWGFFVSAK
jgi:hypothetical protein